MRRHLARTDIEESRDGIEITREMIHELPKADLHVHLDGSLRIGTILDLAKKQGVDLPAGDRDGLSRVLHVPMACKSLEEYLAPFAVTLSVLQEPEALTRAAYELCEDCAAENIRYVEVRFSPILHTRKGLRTTEVLDAVIEGLQEGERTFDIDTGIIVCGMRDIEPRISMRLAELSVAYKNRGVVGFDLAGAEENYPAKKHREAFYLILNNNINCTLHAGEAYGPESIAQAIHYCGAHRIGHGVRLKEDGDLLNYVNDHRIPLEICLTSNVQTKAVPSLEDHPLRLFYDYGLRVTVNTDNRLISNTTLTNELWLAVRTFDFSAQELKMVIIHGFKSAFLTFRKKVNMVDRALREIERYIPSPGREPMLRAETVTENTRAGDDTETSG